jgi:hypothetical protein
MLHDFGAVPVCVDVFPDGYNGPMRETYPFRHRAGWLMVSEARLLLPFARQTQMLLACVTDHCEILAPTVAARLFGMPTSLPVPSDFEPPDSLTDISDALFWDFLGTADLENLRLLEETQETTATKIAEFESRCRALDEKIAAQARALRAERRRSDVRSERRGVLDEALSRLSRLADELPLGMRARLAALRGETEDLETAVMEGLTDPGEVEMLYVVRWEVKSLRGRMRVNLPIFQEEPYSADGGGRSAHPSLEGESILDAVAAIRERPQE